MEWLAAITTGTLAGLGLWMLLDRNLKRVVLGIAVLGNAINLGVFTAGRFIGERAAFVDATNNAATANPLPQALVLTAIVIGFSLFIFALALLKRTRELHGDKTTDSVSSITEQPAPDWHAGEHEADGTGVEARR
jgi:multicomponent Na+:H+ antiporter subunit C